jgi:predicted acetyltransferase
MPALIAPDVRLHAAWCQAHAEWGPGLHEDGFGLRAADEADTAAGFAAWVARLAAQEDTARPAGAARAHCTYRWIVADGQVLGAIALRHEFSDVVRRVGHIGYGIRPSARRRGLATWALGQMLGQARGLGLDRVLLVCEAGNIASARTIERHGGVLEKIQDTTHGAMRRYWITLQGIIGPAQRDGAVST